MVEYPNDTLSFLPGEDNAAGEGAMRAAAGLILTTALLLLFGLTMLYSASSGTAGLQYFRNQILWVAVGGVAGAGAFMIGFRSLAKFGVVWIAGSALLLLYTAAFCAPVKGASRWIRFGGFSIQPSEFAKIAVILFVAQYCSDNYRTINQIRSRTGIAPLVGGVGLILASVWAGHDMGTTVLIALVATVMALAAGVSWKYLVLPGALGIVAAIYVFFFDAMRLGRVTSFLDPEGTQQQGGYQLWNSLLALGSGDWFGVGLMNSRFKMAYLPEQHTDFILSVVGEELGFLAMAVLIAGYGAFTWFGFKISLCARSRLGALLAFGLTMGIILQAVINIGVISGSMPTKGMPAPFMSYGGSNMIATLIAVGLLLSVAAENAMPNYSESYRKRFHSLFSRDKR